VPQNNHKRLDDDVTVALTEARAAWWLLDAIEHEYVHVQYVTLEGSGDGPHGSDEECEGIRQTVFHKALDWLEASLTKAEAAYRDCITKPRAVA
jgi:hypothetical protein